MTDEKDTNMDKLWANSGDSHLMEPSDLFEKRLPTQLAERMPHSVKDPDGAWETVYVDGEEFRRRMPKMPTDPDKIVNLDGSTGQRAPGANDPHLRLKDLDQEGVWAEATYPSIGVWSYSIRTPEVVAAGARAINDWAAEFQSVSPRYVCTAMIPLLDVDDAIAEVHRVTELGMKASFLPIAPPFERPPFANEEWDPLWAAMEEVGMVLGFHVGTEPHTPDQRTGVYNTGRGGALQNYVETTYGAQKITVSMISAGVFDRYPNLKMLISEGGATWGPFIGDRMDEGYRQHSAAVRPKLERMPSEYLDTNVYASFQHDRTAVAANTAMGWKNICWGSDYPHTEGTYGHTQKTLHELFDDVEPETSYRMRIGAFQELFPHVPPAPTS
jgi:predicted TIM-barrel fold metal-dependent hydrolase